MRIVGGRWRGRRLAAPEGRGTRPTTDRIRESLASMVLAAFDLDLSGVRVLDAFAGSGAMGLELLSRGAKSCTFVERDRRSAAIVRDNIERLDAASCARLQVADVHALAARGGLVGGPFSLVVLDPPYATDVAQVAALVSDLRAASELTPDATILYEHAADAPGLDLAGGQTVTSKSHGATAVALLRLKGD